MRSTPLLTLVSLLSFAEHRFFTSQLTFDFATTLLESFSLRRGYLGEATVEPGRAADPSQKTQLEDPGCSS